MKLKKNSSYLLVFCGISSFVLEISIHDANLVSDDVIKRVTKTVCFEQEMLSYFKRLEIKIFGF